MPQLFFFVAFSFFLPLLFHASIVSLYAALPDDCLLFFHADDVPSYAIMRLLISRRFTHIAALFHFAILCYCYVWLRFITFASDDMILFRFLFIFAFSPYWCYALIWLSIDIDDAAHFPTPFFLPRPPFAFDFSPLRDMPLLCLRYYFDYAAACRHPCYAFTRWCFRSPLFFTMLVTLFATFFFFWCLMLLLICWLCHYYFRYYYYFAVIFAILLFFAYFMPSRLPPPCPCSACHFWYILLFLLPLMLEMILHTRLLMLMILIAHARALRCQREMLIDADAWYATSPHYYYAGCLLRLHCHIAGLRCRPLYCFGRHIFAIIFVYIAIYMSFTPHTLDCHIHTHIPLHTILFIRLLIER